MYLENIWTVAVKVRAIQIAISVSSLSSTLLGPETHVGQAQ